MQLLRSGAVSRVARACLHGFAGTPATFVDFVAALDALAAGGAPVPTVCPALPGHGAALPPGLGGWAQAVEDVAAQLPITACHLVGYSMGGRLALAVALSHPERVRTLTLVGSTPGLRTDEERAKRREADLVWQQRLATGGTRAFLEAWQAQPLFASQANVPPARLRAQTQARSALEAEPLAGALACMGTGAMPDYWPQLAALQAPTLLVAGALDAKFVAIHRRVAAALTHVQLAEVPGVGHNVVLEAPGALAELQHAHEVRWS